MVLGRSLARAVAAALAAPLAIAAVTSACLAAETPRLASKPFNPSSHSPVFLEDLLTGRVRVHERHGAPSVMFPGPDLELKNCSSRGDRTGCRFDVPRPVHGGHSAISVADAGSTLSEPEKRQREEEAKRQARLCADWSKGQLVWFFRSASAVDAEQCLKTGASVTIRDRNGRTPLHVAAGTTGDPDVISRLVEAGADVMARTADRSRDTPLHLAAQYNSNVDVVARLIDLGADVNAKNEQRWQPLHRAVWRNQNPEISALLFRRGADTTTTVDYGGIVSTFQASLRDLARSNPRVIKSDWYRELKAKRLAELEEERRTEQKRLAELERERQRLAEDARSRQRKRLAEKAAGIAKEREPCEPVLEEVGLIGSWRKQSRVIAALNDDSASPLDAYADAIPFLLAGAGKHAEVEEAFAARVLRDVDRWVEAGIRRESETLTTWTGVSRLLRENCRHEIADFIVVSVASGAARDFGAIVFWETAGGLPLVQPEVMRALDHVPQGILAELSETGRVNKVPRMLESAIEAAVRAGAKRFVSSCVDYFNAQSELRKGRSLTQVQRDAVTELCSCFHGGASSKGYLSDEPKFTQIMAELIDPENVFSPAHVDIKGILGRCAALHGRSLR